MSSDYVERAFFSGLWSKYLEHYRAMSKTDEMTRRHLVREQLEMTDTAIWGMQDRDEKIRRAAKIAALSYMIAVDF